MIGRVKTYLKEGFSHYGLEICEYGGNIKFHLIQLQRGKKEIFIVQEEIFLTIEQLAESIKKDIPLFLVVNTAKVLTKIMPLNAQSKGEALVHQAFPNLDLSDFYYDLLNTKKNLLISICRIEQVDDYLRHFLELKLNVAGISFGISGICNSISYLPSGRVSISNQHLMLNEESIQKVIPFESDEGDFLQLYTINGLIVKSTYLLSFSNLLGHLLKIGLTSGNLQNLRISLKKESTNKRHFQLLLRSSLMLILSLLFINFLVFNHYYERVESLQDELIINVANKEQLLQLKTKVKNKEDRLNAVLTMSNSSSSMFLDVIGKSLPSSMLLNGIQYQPLQKPLRQSKPIAISKNSIVISGVANNNEEFYSWIETMEESPWMHQVETTDYDYGSKRTSNFSIKITINEKQD